jgi:DNA-binding FrmR family transcriptional regulator
MLFMHERKTTRKQATTSLKKAQTHINKILKMIEDDEYCIDILQQMLAVNGLIKSASNKILKDHLDHCFSEGMKSNDPRKKDELITEVLNILDLEKRNK